MATDSDVPPGLGGVNAQVYAQAGTEHEWRPIQHTRLYTNAFVIEGNKLLLGFKKRGFGAGLYNGFGGKVEPGETPAQAARRELQEEAGIDAPLKYAGSLLFLVDGVDSAFDIRIYAARAYQGVPTESDEMTPGWFSLSDDSLYAGRSPVPQGPFPCRDSHSGPGHTDDKRGVPGPIPVANAVDADSDADSDLPRIPYDKMWADDLHWLPCLVRGEQFVGRADFDAGNVMRRYWFGRVSDCSGDLV